MKNKLAVIVMMVSLSLSACGAKKPEGTYVADGLGEMVFEGDHMTMGGAEYKFKMEDGKVKIDMPGGTVLVMNVNDDGSLQSDIVGGPYKKRDPNSKTK